MGTVTADPYGVRNHLRKLLETKFAVSVFIGFHNSLIYNLLQLRVLPTEMVSSRGCRGNVPVWRLTDLEVTPNHHL